VRPRSHDHFAAVAGGAEMKIIQIAATETNNEEAQGTLYALGDDGSLWLLCDPWHKENTRWCKLPLPGEDE
jgi:hypothetical protein